MDCSEPNGNDEKEIKEIIDKKSRYYDAGGIETLDIIQAKLTPEQFEGYCVGNALKYLSRLNFKHIDLAEKKRDIRKAVNYLVYLEKVKDENNNLR